MQIQSSNIKSAEYDRENRILTMVFINRPRWVYHYYNVPSSIWVRFIRATSKGVFFAHHIKDVYLFKRKVI